MISRMAADNDFYKATCTNLLERMVNTVPKDVTLVDLSTPYVVKPIQLYATVSLNGTMVVSGIVRASLNPLGSSNAINTAAGL